MYLSKEVGLWDSMFWMQLQYTEGIPLAPTSPPNVYQMVGCSEDPLRETMGEGPVNLVPRTLGLEFERSWKLVLNWTQKQIRTCWCCHRGTQMISISGFSQQPGGSIMDQSWLLHTFERMFHMDHIEMSLRHPVGLFLHSVKALTQMNDFLMFQPPNYLPSKNCLWCAIKAEKGTMW